MSRRRILEHRRHSLAEIREIMNSMKTLAFMETRKLARFLDAQHAVVRSIEEVAADFLSFHPETLPAVKEIEAQKTTSVYLLLGTERGFCGDLNHVLLKHLPPPSQAHTSAEPRLIVIGRKLSVLLEDDPRVAGGIDGASVVEEITAVLNQLAEMISELQANYGALDIYCLYHNEEDAVAMQKFLPPFQNLRQRTQTFFHPPVLNQPPKEFLVELTDHYLFAALHEILYTSLMVENHHRVAHLEGAINHLDEQADELTRQFNAQRQEDIIEEIEVILLSAASLGEKPGVPGNSNTANT